MTDSNQSHPIQSRRVIVASLLALTLLSGVVHGYLDGRWTTQTSRSDQATLLNQLPTAIGPWTMLDEQQLPESTQRLLRCYGSVVRVYQHTETGVMVNFAIMYGPRGPIAVHTPEVCYSSVGTNQTRPRRMETFETKENRHHVWSVEFSRDDEPEASLAVYYGWSDGGAFVAADSPRFWLTDDLYKIQLAGPVTGSAIDPCHSFLEAFLPHLEKLVQ
ncbi:hypothetical protein CKO51_25960 [Rhodopirellula sp. SM50]|nr:exosortase-associated EpsI family protein [Rhodopirellula sp. SM50]PAY16621.1 hypothetical protein CKO51_25960 [Rhodopirellula sp. SM50]